MSLIKSYLGKLDEFEMHTSLPLDSNPKWSLKSLRVNWMTLSRKIYSRPLKDILRLH